MRNLAMLAAMAMAMAGCSNGNNIRLGATNYKGQPLSAVVAKLGQPESQETNAGQKTYVWNVGQSLWPCRIRVTMAGDVIDSYETSGDPNICGSYAGYAS
jgi:hypothetical protein